MSLAAEYRKRRIVEVEIDEGLIFKVRKLSTIQSIELFRGLGVSDFTNQNAIMSAFKEKPKEAIYKVLKAIMVEPKIVDAEEGDEESLSVYEIDIETFNKLLSAATGMSGAGGNPEKFRPKGNP